MSVPAPVVQGDLLGGEAPEPRRKRRGRPLNSPNRNNAMTRAYILARFDNPLEGLVALSMPSDALEIAAKAHALARSFRCTIREAIEIMAKCSAIALPYLNSPMPQELKVNTQRVVLAVGVGAAPGPGERAGGGLGELRRLMIERARHATPEGAEILAAVAESIDDENDDKSDG